MTALTKLWLFLLTLCAGLLVLALLVLLPELGRVRREDQTAGMQLAQRTATLLLAEQAQHLVAAATQLASDAVLQSSLEEMGRGQAELAVLHSTAQMQLQRQSRDKALRAAFLLATDARGRVLARVGQDEAVYRDALDGWPLVSDALRGYRLDDLWLWQGTLYRVAAAPVVAPARDRYVGAVLVAQVVGNELAQALARVSGLDAVFLCAGEVVGASLPRERIAVPELLALRASGSPAGVLPGAAAGAAAEQRAVLPGSGEPVGFVGLPGTAANQGAVLVLLGRSMAGTSAWEVARGAAARGLPPRLLLLLVAAVAVGFAVGLLLLRLEVEAPIERLLAALPTMKSGSPAARGSAAASASPPVESALPLAEAGFRGPLRQLTQALREALRAAPAVPASPGSAAAPHGLAETPAPPSSPAAAASPSPAASLSPPAAAPLLAATRPPAAAPAQLAATPGQPSAAASQPSASPQLATPGQLAAAPSKQPVAPPQLAAPPLPPAAAPLLDSLPTPTLPTPPAMQAVAAPAAGADAAAVPTAVSTHIHTEETRVATGAAADDLQTAYYRIYQEFVLARERCQESVEGLNFELFQQRLQQSREQIIHQHSCKAVQFHVHIKDGRATLRATPIWT